MEQEENKRKQDQRRQYLAELDRQRMEKVSTKLREETSKREELKRAREQEEMLKRNTDLQ